MVSAILSPCLYLKDNELKNLGELIEVLEFINEFLNIDFNLPNTSILHENNWYSLPKYKPIIYNQFTTIIVPLLKKLCKNFTSIYIMDNDIKYSIPDKEYLITDEEEFNAIVNYIYQYQKEYLLFVGNANKDIDEKLNITVKEAVFSIPVIKNVWLDESGYFDNFIKEDIKDYDDIFPCKKLCSKIGNEILEIGNKALFKKYGKIVAKRNGFHKLPYTSRQYKNVPYYMRNDQEYIVCIDTLHGFYEVFHKSGSKYEDYKGEYDFSCNKVYGKISPSETHICYKSY